MTFNLNRLDILKKKGLLPDTPKKEQKELSINGFTFNGDFYIKELRISLSNDEKEIICSKNDIYIKFLDKTLDLNKIVFFDLETTGLSTGSGCIAFLAGLAFFDGSEIVFKQYFLPSYSKEKSFIDKIFNDIDNKSLISFNGKAYDINLFKSRCTFLNAGRGSKSENVRKLTICEHIDLLHISRSFFKGKIGSCSLKMLEKYVLNEERVGDIDGFLVPERYFDFLRTGNTDELETVFLHNQIDVLSMIKLLFLYVSIFEKENFERIDYYSTAKYLLRNNLNALSIKILECGIKEKDEKCKTLLSLIYKKNGELSKSIQLWDEQIKSFNIEAYKELAKYYEHKACDYKKALELVQQIIEKLELRKSLDKPVDKTVYNEFTRRKERLFRKMNQGCGTFSS